MSFNLNANLVNDLARYNGNIMNSMPSFMNDYTENTSKNDKQMRFNSTMTDMINSDAKNAIVNIPNASSVAYLTDVQAPNRIRNKSLETVNWTAKEDKINDDIMTLDEKKEMFAFKDLVNSRVNLSKDISIIIIICIIIFLLYTIINIYTSQKKLEFMINFMYENQHKPKM